MRNKLAIFLSFCLIPLTYAETQQEVVNAARARANLLKTRTSNLFVVNLPAGDVSGVNINWFNNGVPVRYPSEWLSQGYEGIVFRGQGVDVTHMRASGWDGQTISIGRHNGIVRFENMTVHAGYDRASSFGQQNISKDNFPGFQVELVNVKGVVDQPIYFFNRDNKFRITNGGMGYSVGNEITVLGGEGTPAKFRVSAIGANGAVTTLSILSKGSYSKPPRFGEGGALTTSNGVGAGLRVDLGARPKWLWFGYNVDLFMHNVWSNAKQAVEHASYMHGFAQHGAYVLNSTFYASGAENFKVRSDATETRWAGPNQIIYLADNTFRDWFQCWSWRGGGGVVVQGSSAHLVMERNIAKGGGSLNCRGFYPDVASNFRSLSVAVSSEGESYDQQTGVVGTGYGNGFIYIDNLAAYGSSDVDFRNNLIRVAKNSGAQKSARGVTIKNSSLWGKKMFITVGDIDSGTGSLSASNTPALRNFANQLGWDTTFEAVVPRFPLVPVSQGATW